MFKHCKEALNLLAEIEQNIISLRALGAETTFEEHLKEAQEYARTRPISIREASAHLLNKSKVSNIVKTCGACPAQWEGKTIDDKEIYIRYRYGVLRAYIDSGLIYEEVVGSGLDGVMSDEKMAEHLKYVLEF